MKKLTELFFIVFLQFKIYYNDVDHRLDLKCPGNAQWI